MRSRLLLTMIPATVAGVLVVGVPSAVVAHGGLRVLILSLSAAAIVAAVVAAFLQSRALTRPIAELAEAADRLRSGDPRPVGRRYGIVELDQVADGLDSSGRRVTSLLAAERELAIDSAVSGVRS